GYGPARFLEIGRRSMLAESIFVLGGLPYLGKLFLGGEQASLAVFLDLSARCLGLILDHRRGFLVAGGKAGLGFLIFALDGLRLVAKSFLATHFQLSPRRRRFAKRMQRFPLPPPNRLFLFFLHPRSLTRTLAASSPVQCSGDRWRSTWR